MKWFFQRSLNLFDVFIVIASIYILWNSGDKWYNFLFAMILMIVGAALSVAGELYYDL